MSDEQKSIDQLYRKLQSFDVVCFDKCVKDPQKKLGNNEEHCLKACSIKMINALHFMSSLNRNGGVDRLQPINETKSKSFF